MTSSEQKNPRVRNAVGTWNNYSEEGVQRLEEFLEDVCTYGVYGKEVGEQGTPHLQVYFELPKQMSWTAINKKLGNKKGGEWMDMASRRGTPKEAAGYCMKGDNEKPEGGYAVFFDEPSETWDGKQYGEISNQGERTDVKRKIEEVQNGETTVDDIVLNDPSFYHQYGRTLREAEAILLRKKFRTEMTEGIWLTGETGAGKSHAVFQNFDPEKMYVKNLNEDWWDGYKGQEIVILNEFRGQIRFSELLDLADKWPKSVKWRNREPVPFLAKKVIITCVKEPKSVYKNLEEDETWAQFERRFKVITVEKGQSIIL